MNGFEAGMPLLGWADLQIQGQPIGKMPGVLLGDVILIIVLAVGVLLGLMLLVRYLYTRRPRKRHTSNSRKVFRQGQPPEDGGESEADSAEARRRYKYRWKRREHRVRNPSLAETGGLPPARNEDSTQPS